MSVAELQELEEVKGLIARGQQVGVLTYAEIATATAELDLDETDLEELHGSFERRRDRAGRGDRPSDRGGPEHRARARQARPTQAQGGARSQAGHHDGFAAAVPQGHRQGAAADRPGRGRARQADLARGPGRQAEDGRVEPAARRFDREELPQPGAAVSGPDPGRHDRSGARGGEVRLPQGLQVLDVCDLVDPPGDRACAG